MILLKIIYESIRLAFGQLSGNKLRTFLSLLGISIGIFCIIVVQSAVDSLYSSIEDGFGELGSDIVMIDVLPWDEDPGDSYWKYLKRPAPSFNDYEELKGRVKSASKFAFSIYVEGKTVKYKSSSVQGAFIMGTTEEFPDVQDMEIVQGRYFNTREIENGDTKVIIGHKIAEALFENEDPIGKYVKLFGQKFQVIATLKEEGENPFNFINYDEVTWLTYNTAKRFINTKGKDRFSVGKIIYAKLQEGYEMHEMKDELTGTLRAIRRLHPKEEDNFSLNELTALTNLIGPIFSVVRVAGLFIGIFAILIGAISVANIMFVSVRERTGIIGVKKALGAKRHFILLEFLIEAIVLCLVGGLMGLGLVFLVLKGLSFVIPFEMAMSTFNLVIGLVVAVIVGILSGIIPAFLAARLDPVEAIRRG